MPDKSDEYRQHAVHCRNMADAMKSQVMKAQWLRLADKWLDMVTDSPRLAALSAMLEEIGVEGWHSR